MNKNDKVGAIVLGAVLFGSLFYVIYSSIFGPQPDYSALSSENFISDEFDNGDDIDVDVDEEAASPAPAAADKTTAPAATKPVVQPLPAEKK
jgi:hypothetical protein